MNECQTTDIVILVTGLSGAGKSTFLNAVLEKDCMLVGHSLRPCTTKVEPATIQSIPDYPEMAGRRLVVVDTPGFDNIYGNDTQVLRQISEWLQQCPQNWKLGGVIYLHEIHQDRVPNVTGTDLNLLRRSFGRIVLATTKWGKVTSEEGHSRVRQLQKTHWKNLGERGSKVPQFGDNHESAWEIIRILLQDFKDEPGFDIKTTVAELGKLQLNTKDKTRNVREQFPHFFGLFGTGGNSVGSRVM